VPSDTGIASRVRIAQGLSAALVSELHAKRVEFCAAAITEITKKIDRPAVRQLPQLYGLSEFTLKCCAQKLKQRKLTLTNSNNV
jgi:hypothetical protein